MPRHLDQRTGPLADMRRRHQTELRELCFNAISEAGTVKGAAHQLGCDRSWLNKVLSDAGTTGSDVLHANDGMGPENGIVRILATQRGATSRG